MKLVFYEIKKVICKKVFFVVLALCFVLNIVIFCYTQNNSEYNQFADSDFKLMAENYAKMPLNDARQKLEEAYKAYQIINLINSANDAQTDEEINSLLKSIDEYKEAESKLYELAENMSKSGEYDEEHQYFTYILLEQAKYIESYPSFINDMEKRAEDQSAFTIFNNQNDFSYKNLYKTAEDYEHLSNIKLIMGNDIPLKVIVNYSVTDFFLIAISFLVCVYIFNTEKEAGLYSLVRSSLNGRAKTAIAKLIALVVLIVIIVAVFVINNYFITSYFYGNLDFSRTVQSVSEYRNCIFKLNIGEFCLLNIVNKIAGVLVISIFFALMFVAFSNSFMPYAISIIVLAVEFICKNLLPNLTVFTYAKYINVFYMLDTQNFLGSYMNLNIFSNPVAVYIINIIVFSIIVVLCVTSTIAIFSKKYLTAKAGLITSFNEKIKSKYCKINGSTSIFRGEIFKLTILNKIGFVLLAVLLFSIYSSVGYENYPYSDKSDPFYKEYMQYLEGDITDDKIAYINAEQEYFNNLNLKLEEVALNDQISESSKNVIQNTINNIFETKGVAFNRVCEQYSYLQKLKSNNIDAKFIDENLYPQFISNSQREWTDIALCIIILLTCIPFIFSVEYKKGIIKLLRSSKYGKVRLFICKSALAFALFVIIFAFINLPYLIKFINTFGTKSFNVPIICMNLYSSAGESITVIQAFVLNLICYFVICMLMVAVIMKVSVLVKGHMLTVIISTIITLIPCIIIYPYDTIRVGNMYYGNYIMIAIIIIAMCVIITCICLMAAIIKFTDVSIRRKKYDKS